MQTLERFNKMNQIVNFGFPARQPILVPVGEQLHEPEYVLAREAATGAKDAIGDLYQLHGRRVYSLCFRMTRNAEEAEDLTQEVFIQLLRKIGSFRGKSQFTTWLYRLTVNQVLMHFRRVTRRKEQMPGDIEVELKFPNKRSVDINFIERIALNAALAKLPSGCRAVFLLFDVEGYNHEEIAKLFGCSIGNSKSQLHKARRKLRRLLEI